MSDSIAARARPYQESLRDAGSRFLTSVRRPWAEAVLLSAALSLLFILVYGVCNDLASRRTDLGVCFFAWELRIPFVPALIVPYMSIDLFFAASFLLCADRIELRTHAWRIALAILVAGLAFLVFPLTAGYPRPEVSGWTGKLFEFLWSFDKPHNLVPSLHVALASLLWPVYARHSPPHPYGALRWFVHGWFALIVASPLFTWQHHLLDVATGAMLGQVCLFAFPERRDRSGARGRVPSADSQNRRLIWRECDRSGARRNRNRAHICSAAANLAVEWRERSLVRSAPNLRVARFYGMGSAALGILALALGSWFLLLLWPAASLALIAVAYVRGSSAVFRKSGGRLPISTRVVLFPYLCGAFVRLLVYRPRGKPRVEAAPGVFCGRLLTKREARAVRAMGVTGVLDLTAEHAETWAFLEVEYLNTAGLSLQEIGYLNVPLEYLNVPVLDLTEPSREQLDIAVAFMAEHARRGGVYVHCALGVSRSVAAAAAYVASQQSEPNPALRRSVRSAGPKNLGTRF